MVGYQARRSKQPPASHAVLNVATATALPVLVLLWWQFASTHGLVRPSLFPPPTQLASTFASLVTSGTLGKALAISFARVFTGFAIGTTLGVITGFLMGLFPVVDRALSLFTSVLRPIPIIALIPLFIVLFGIGELTNVTLIVIASFWPVLLNTISGIRNVNDRLLEFAYAYRIPSARTVFQIILPSSVSSIITGIRLGLGAAWMSVVAAEMIGAGNGIGYLIMYSRELAQTGSLYVYVLIIGLIGLLLDRMLLVLQTKLTRTFKGKTD